MLNTALDISYARLPGHFFTRVDPTPVAAPRLIQFNEALALELGLDVGGLDAAALAQIFSGNRVVAGSHPIAMAYAGHQFGHFVPQLGDGRAILVGEVRDRLGNRRDIQLKGSGRTPYSRGGDGRAVVGPVLREYLVSEAMHALGIPATRALAAVATGEVVVRERQLPGAILTRVAAGHVRIGTFQFFAARGDVDATRRLADYVIERHHPRAAAAANPYLELLRSVIRAQASLIARWMQVGFIHGVMNTDNMSVAGETIDFGPCAFMDGYEAGAVFSSIDSQGRYAYGNQPVAAQWNLARFAETLLPLLDASSDAAVTLATDAVAGFTPEFDARWLDGMRRKVGLLTAEEGDGALIRDLLDCMQAGGADFTLTFRRLSNAVGAARQRRPGTGPGPVRTFPRCLRSRSGYAAGSRDGARACRVSRRPRTSGRPSCAARIPPVIPRNHRVEQIIVAAVEQQDFGPFERLSRALARPYEEQAPARPVRDAGAGEDYALPPRADERVLQTFCGT